APAAPAAGDAANQASAPPPARQSTAGYRGLNEFVITYRRGEGNANYSAIFRREGLVTWKLAAIDLNE
ncbi:putative transmembrane protein, partial [Burkholderia sp. H160]